MPVAAQNIGPRTKIDAKMVQTVRVPRNLLQGEFYTYTKDIVGKYTNFTTTVPKGSLFYTSLIVNASDIPSSMFKDVPDGYVVVNYPVNMDTTYLNSMEPDSYVNMYFKGLYQENEDDEEQVIFGKFIQNIKVLGVKDADGKNVFETSEEIRKPAYLFFAVPEDRYDLLRKAMYISGEYDIELTLVPNTMELTEKDALQVTSNDIKTFIMDRTMLIDINIEIEDDGVLDIEKYKEEYKKKIADSKAKESDKNNNNNKKNQ